MPLKLKRYAARGPNWYLRGTVRGCYVFETTGTHDKAAAETLRIKRENDLLQRAVFGAGTNVTFAEAAVSYLAKGGEARFLGRYDEGAGEWTLLIGHFNKTPVVQIDQDAIDRAAVKLYPNAKPATRKRQVYAPVAAVLHHCADNKWIRVPKIKHPKVKQPETRYSTIERMNKLLPHCSPKLRRLVVFLAYTGARISECLRIDWEQDMQLAERIAHVGRTKNGDRRAVHLPDPVLIELAAVPEAERKGQVFKWKARHAVYKPLRRACKLAGVPYMATHAQGRHTFAAGLRIHAKRDLRGLMEDGGWKSIQSVMRYMHVTPGETAAAVDRLPHVQIPCTTDEATDKSVKKKRKKTA
jgi:integrase